MADAPGLAPYNPAVGTELLGDVWQLCKGQGRMACQVSTHPLGWELRLETGGMLVFSHVCKTRGAVSTIADEWNALAQTRGWTAG